MFALLLLSAQGALLRSPILHTAARSPKSSVRMMDVTPVLPVFGSSSLLATTAAERLFDPASDPIGFAFEFVTLVPQPFWLLMVLLPNWKGTRLLFEPIQPIAVLSLLHLLIVVLSTQGTPETGTAPLELFNGLFDANEDGIATYLELGNYKNFVSEEWTHTLIWDLFVGRFIWLDGRKREIFTSHSVLLTNLIGPPGLLLHLATCLVLKKGLPEERAEPREV